MQFNIIGPAAALATFLGVWLGHVSVRKLERETVHLWKPTLLMIILGIGMEIASFLTSSLTLSAMCGIFAVTFLWDAFEVSVRQTKRIKRGHAPANPNNLRHAKILADYPEASTVDWLHREPRGSIYTTEELTSIKEGAE